MNAPIPSTKAARGARWGRRLAVVVVGFMLTGGAVYCALNRGHQRYTLPPETLRDAGMGQMAGCLERLQLRDGELPPDSEEGQQTVRACAAGVEEYLQRLKVAGSQGRFLLPDFEYSCPPGARFDRHSEETVLLSESIAQPPTGPRRFLSSRGFLYLYTASPRSSEPVHASAGMPVALLRSRGVIIERRFATWEIAEADSLKLLWLYRRLKAYEEEHGALPYDARGSAYALYLLKESDAPDSPSPLEWEDASQRVNGVEYDYINRPNQHLDEGVRAPYVVVAERVGEAVDPPTLYLSSTGARVLATLSTERLNKDHHLAGLSIAEAKNLTTEFLKAWHASEAELPATSPPAS